jgi:hypothetical protein
METQIFQNKFFRITCGGAYALAVATQGEAYHLAVPVFEIDGQEAHFVFAGHSGGDVFFHQEGSETTRLILTLRAHPESPVIRFRYTLYSEEPISLTKTSGRDNITHGRFFG